MALDREKKTESSAVEFDQRDDTLVVRLSGRLDYDGIADIWQKCVSKVAGVSSVKITVDAAGVDYLDGAGTALLREFKHVAEENDKNFELTGLAGRLENIYRMMEMDTPVGSKQKKYNFRRIVADIGSAATDIFSDIVEQVSFIGQIFASMLVLVRNPKRMRWRDFFLTAENAGANAVGIVALLGFLIGLILAFQSAVSLKRFGAEVYVADLVSISVIRELGPLITAIILAGRSGSAFAAELGTMKINQEVDALKTMGIDPVVFLTTSRLSSAILVTPVLTMFANIFALIGCGVVMVSLGFPVSTYLDRIDYMVSMTDFLGGTVKAFVFGFVVAAVGCLRGFQTTSGATAVGNAATRAVVSGIILIVVVDGIFAVVYYFLGI